MKLMKRIVFACLILGLIENAALGDQKGDAAFVDKVRTAFMNHSCESLVGLSLWTGVSEEDKKQAIKKYESEVALHMTKIEFKDAEQSRWRNWKQGEVEYTYNLPVTKQVVVHVEKGSKIKLRFGEVPIKDVTMPVGEKDGKWYLLKSVKVISK